MVETIMTIEERIVRNNQEDVIWIGMALDSFYNSDAGTIFRAMANAITHEQFINTDDHVTPADKKLGRAEGVNLIIERIERAIEDMNRLNAEIKEEQRLEG